MPEIQQGVAGSDGIVPVYDPEGLWRMWNIDQVWLNPSENGSGKFVPKVNDYVIDPREFTTYIVTHLDAVTLVPTLEPIRPSGMIFDLSQDDVLFGVGPGTQADTYRGYLDTSVMPFKLSLDQRLRIAGSMTSYAKIFLGSDLSDTGHVISKVYDASGRFVSENIPLEVAAEDGVNNRTIKTVPTCACTDEMADGEVITAVFYSDNGHVVSKRQLLVENTTFIRAIGAPKRYVSHISLESPFLSPLNPKSIQFPLNVPITALNIMGVVSYTDGSTVKLPVDGEKFRVLGLEQYVSTIIGQRIPLVLRYALGTDEGSTNGTTSDNHYVTEQYSITTINPNNSYAVKIFGYPVWIDDANGYRMSWFLLDLDRDFCVDVTPYVRFAENTGAFDPRADGYNQQKSIMLNLADVNGSYKPFIHTQIVDITLWTPPGTRQTPWTVSHESVNGQSMYGTLLRAMRDSNSPGSVKIDSSRGDVDTWLQDVYYNTYPLYDREFEQGPPVPTHFELSYKNKKTEYPIEDWNASLSVGVDFQVGGTLFIKFFKRTTTTDLQLGISGMYISQN